MPKTIEVAKITARGNRIEYLLQDKTGLNLLKKESLTAWIEFCNPEQFGFATEDVPEAVLAVPITLFLYPATWFYGVDLAVPAIDKTLHDDLDAIYAAYSNVAGPFNPEWRGKVVPAKIEEAPMPPAAFEKLVFFSGGVDAVHAAINNAGPKNVLASVPSMETMIKNKGKSPDAGKDFLEVKSRLIRDFSKVVNSPWILATNNLNADVFAAQRIDWDLKRKFGVTKLALYHMTKLGNMLSVAPFAWAKGIKTLVMGSGHELMENKPLLCIDGDHPSLSNSIKFADVSFAEQDGLSTRRTEKVCDIVASPVIKEYKKQGGGKLPFGPAFQILLCSAASAPSASARSLIS